MIFIRTARHILAGCFAFRVVLHNYNGDDLKCDHHEVAMRMPKHQLSLRHLFLAFVPFSFAFVLIRIGLDGQILATILGGYVVVATVCVLIGYLIAGRKGAESGLLGCIMIAWLALTHILYLVL